MKKIICMLAVCILACGCGRNGSGHRLKVAATIFPYYDFARNIGGERAEAVMLIPPGSDPHKYKPAREDVRRISGCDILIYNGSGLEPWMPELLKALDRPGMIIINASAIAGNRIINTQVKPASGEDEEMKDPVPEGIDPHIWLDFDIDTMVISEILKGMCGKDPANADYYSSNSGFYRIRLNQLAVKYRETLAQDNNRTILYSGHYALGYMARRYRLKLYSPYRDYSSEPEATQRSIAGISLRAGNLGAGYIFCEELSDMKVARAITGESGMKILLIHGCHNVSQAEFDSGIDFISIMDNNLENLITGMKY